MAVIPDPAQPLENSLSWNRKKVLVTGGASFIGSHLVDHLLDLGADVRVVDDFSTGLHTNLQTHLYSSRTELLQGNLLEPGVARSAMSGREVVFHMAAIHGGRGYVDLHQADPASNLALDGLVFREALRAGVEKVLFASSGCVYPNALQDDPDAEVFLTEDLVRPPYDADNMYGWAKLMAELTLRSYWQEYGMGAACCRYFTAYGPRALEGHAIMAMMARALVRQDPFEIWGEGTQVRNWTYIDDIVRGTILAAERIDDGTAVNIGTMERVRVIDAAREILRYASYDAEIRRLEYMPTGPANRVADNSLARKRLGWTPQVPFVEGLQRTMDWYFNTKSVSEVNRILSGSLTERR
jgi:nucleoside-diphosphate-sugar epimerase